LLFMLLLLLLPVLVIWGAWTLLDPQAVVDEIQGRPAGGPVDGRGTAVIEPDLIPANSSGNSFILRYTAGPGGIATGGGIQFYFPTQVVDYPGGRKIEPLLFNNWWYMLNPAMYTRNFYAASVPENVRIKVEGVGIYHIFRVMGSFLKSTNEGKPVINMKDANKEISRIRIKITKGRLDEGQIIVIAVGNGGQLKTPHYPTHVNVAVETDTDGDGGYALIGNSPELSTRCEARELHVFAPSTPRPGERFKVAVVSGCADIYPEPDPMYTAAVRLESEGLDIPRGVTIRKGQGGMAEFEATAPAEGVYWIRAKDVKRGFDATSNAIVCRESGPRLYWGDIHRHNILGDGEWKPTTVLNHARFIEHLDFVSLSEHDLNQVTYYMVKDRDLTRVPDVRQTQQKWDYLETLARRYETPGKFAAIAGYEWTSHEAGHRNGYFHPRADTEYLNHLDPPGNKVNTLLHHYAGSPVVFAVHHPAWRGGEEQGDMIDWGDRNFSESVQKLVEVYSQHGCSEYYGTPYPVHAKSVMFIALPRGVDDDGQPNPEAPWYIPIKGYQATDASPPGMGNYVQEILAQGYKLSMIAGSDAHFISHYKMSYPNGVMAAWARSLTGENIWQALNGRRVYGTTGARIYIDFTVSGRPIGSDFETEGPPVLKAFIAGDSPISKAEVVRFMDGEYSTIITQNSKSPECGFTFTDSSFSGEGFYYLRVTQADEEMGWAGPVWVTRNTGSSVAAPPAKAKPGDLFGESK